MASFSVNLRTSASLHPREGPNEFVSEYHGAITCTDDDSGQAKNVGRVHALKVHASLAADYGESLFAICDSHSQELHLLHTLLYEPEGYSFRSPIEDKFDAIEWDLLVLDYVVLAPKWRGLKIGLLAARKVVDLLGGGCGLAVSLIAPLRHDSHTLLNVPPSWIPRSPDKESRRAAAVKLRQYYRRMGFVRLGRTAYYALSMMKTMPASEELLEPE